MKRWLVLGILWFAASSFADDAEFPWLADLDAGEEVKASGERLVNLPYGLHALEKPEATGIEMVVGVHGMRSEGYEWVYPLQTIDTDTTQTFFFNWDTTAGQCQLDVVQTIKQSIETELAENTEIESVSIFGHSLGGMVVAQLADAWEAEVPLTIHAIAAPLTFLDRESDNPDCVLTLPKNETINVRMIEWRTQFELDNAFNRMDHNPMEVDIPGSIVVDLPDTYRDRRLGHNWSISFVADRIASD